MPNRKRRQRFVGGERKIPFSTMNDITRTLDKHDTLKPGQFNSSRVQAEAVEFRQTTRIAEIADGDKLTAGQTAEAHPVVWNSDDQKWEADTSRTIEVVANPLDPDLLILGGERFAYVFHEQSGKHVPLSPVVVQRFFKTAAREESSSGESSESYPAEADDPDENPTVYYAVMLENVSFLELEGQQSLTFTETDQTEFLFNLSTDDYIEEGSIVLAWKIGGQWYTIDKVAAKLTKLSVEKLSAEGKFVWAWDVRDNEQGDDEDVFATADTQFALAVSPEHDLVVSVGIWRNALVTGVRQDHNVFAFGLNGAFKWSRSLGFDNDSPERIDVAIDSQGNVIVSGREVDPAEPQRFDVTKLDSDGNTLWQLTRRTPANLDGLNMLLGARELLLLDVDGSDNIFIGTEERPSPGTETTVVDPGGNILQESAVGSDALAVVGQAFYSAATGDEDVFGETRNSLQRRDKDDLEAGPVWEESLPVNDTVNAIAAVELDDSGESHLIVVGFEGKMLAFDESGNLLWQTPFGGSDDTLLSVAADQSFIYAGGTVIEGFHEESSSSSGSSGPARVENVVRKYDHSGNLLWETRRTKETLQVRDAVRGIDADAEGNVYTTGHQVNTKHPVSRFPV